jgi:transcriptional regulator with XRE-family HTH domain
MSPVNVNAIGAYIREQREQARISIRQLAQAAGVSNPYLSQVERGLRRPSADILQQIAKGLRISAEALYVQAGILEDKPGEVSVTDAIMADSVITERQKVMLIDIYESFRKEVRADAEARRAAGVGGESARGDAAGPDEDFDESVGEGYAESGNDPVIEAVAAAEAERWADPSAAADTASSR